MQNWLTYVVPPVLAALGFLLGFFYTRTNKKIDEIPTTYMSKQDCLQIRGECLHMRDTSRQEILDRFDRMEDKFDELTATLLKK